MPHEILKGFCVKERVKRVKRIFVIILYYIKAQFWNSLGRHKFSTFFVGSRFFSVLKIFLCEKKLQKKKDKLFVDKMFSVTFV